MKIVTNWGRKTDQEQLYKKSRKWSEKNYERKMQEETVMY